MTPLNIGTLFCLAANKGDESDRGVVTIIGNMTGMNRKTAVAYLIFVTGTTGGARVK